jgi:hypothetical protein
MKAAPQGWHLPSNDEWQTLVDFAGGEDIAGKKLKAKSGWNDDEGESGNGTDEYGFPPCRAAAAIPMAISTMSASTAAGGVARSTVAATLRTACLVFVASKDKLLFSLRHAHELKTKPEQFGEGIFDKIFDIAQIARFSKEERAKYEANMMNQRDQYAALKCARDEGEARGLERAAKSMLEDGLEPERVARITKLPKEQIMALSN